jgi:hypothetical protein
MTTTQQTSTKPEHLLARREALLRGMRGVAGVGLAVGAWPVMAQAIAAKPLVQVWKSPTCGCCKDWVAYLEANGFDTQVFDVGNTAARAKFGLSQQFGSCHTALLNGYVIEGHVTASAMKRLLRERPAALGLAVPGMPIGSPGMDGPAYNGRRDAFDVLLVQKDGSAAVFERHA